MDGTLRDMCDVGAFKTQIMLSCCHKKSTITMMKSLVIYILRDGMGRIMYCGHKCRSAVSPGEQQARAGWGTAQGRAVVIERSQHAPRG